MTRYDRPYQRRYDLGMRGFTQTTRPLGRRTLRRPRYDRYYAGSYSGVDDEIPLRNRVTQRYNREYVDDALNRARSYGYGFGADRRDRIVEENFYRRPYATIGGTRTQRGVSRPPPYDPSHFGRAFDDRFPDEF